MLVKKAGKETIKYINKQNILSTFWNREEVAKAEVIAATHLSAATVSALMQELVEEGFLQECRMGESSGGRRPVMYTLNQSLAYILTLQVTTKGVLMGVVNLSGKVIDRKMRFSLLHGEQAVREAVEQAIQDFLTLHPEKAEKTQAVTISVPGVVDYAACRLTYSAALFAENLDLQAVVQQAFAGFEQQPDVYLFKDTDALALGELACAQQSDENMAYILCENGVGMSVVHRGNLFLGDRCGMELGHTTVDLHGETCKCGARGCVGLLIGEQPAVKRYTELYEQQNGEWTSNPMFLKYEDIVELYMGRDPIARRVIDEQLETLAVTMVNVVNLFNPDWLIVGGPLAKLPEIETAVAAQVRQKALKPFTENLRITSSKIGAEAALLGMANYVLQKEIFKSVRF